MYLLKIKCHVSFISLLYMIKLFQVFKTLTIIIIIPHPNFQQSDWSICQATILNVTQHASVVK